jgi:hypothetical protein
MSVILQFRSDVPRRARPAPSSDERRGEILFFTGIRVERHLDDTIDPHTHSSPSARTGRRRKA